MKVPDKVFFPNDINLLTKLSLVIKQKDDVCYIRKDALLEWLQKEYETISWYNEKMQHVTGCVGNTDSSRKAEAYKKVINKLNSM